MLFESQIMNLASLNTASAANAGAVLTVLHPTDRTPLKQADGTSITITVLGRDSEEFNRAERRNRKIQREAVMKRQPYSPADEDRAADAALAACTVAWTGIPAAWLVPDSTDEKPAPFTPEAALALYGNPGLRWLRDQVDEFIGERAHFLKASSKA